jgi:hypothetical protein
MKESILHVEPKLRAGKNALLRCNSFHAFEEFRYASLVTPLGIRGIKTSNAGARGTKKKNKGFSADELFDEEDDVEGGFGNEKGRLGSGDEADDDEGGDDMSVTEDDADSDPEFEVSL